MLTTLRRCPTSITRSLVALSSPLRQSLIARPRLSLRVLQRLPVTQLDRQLHSTTQWRRNSAAVAEVEEEDMMEDEELDGDALKENDHAEANDSHRHSNIKQQGGLITKFQDLADQQMVSPTVIKTLTQDMNLETMTQVQSMTINETLKGIDV